MIRTALVLALFTIPAFAADRESITCSADGRMGQPAFARADISFELTRDADGLRTLHNLRGEIRAAGSARDLDSKDDAYIGIFAVSRVEENPKYRPVKYKNSSQFQKIDAKETRGAESGMWGSLIVPRDTRGEFEAHYIFQAGDHMGGTVHMSCRRER